MPCGDCSQLRVDELKLIICDIQDKLVNCCKPAPRDLSIWQAQLTAAQAELLACLIGSNSSEEDYAGQTCYDNGTTEEGLAIRLLVKTNGIVTSIKYIDATTGVDVTSLVTGCITCCG